MRSNIRRYALLIGLMTGCVIGGWSLLAMVAGLRHAHWQVTELIRQYMVATGMIKPFNTLVDFYTHIKGVEYLICVAFFVAFPLFYRYVNEDRSRIRRSTKTRY